MNASFKAYRQNARRAVRELLSHKGDALVFYYTNKVNIASTEAEVSRILFEVRREI